MRTLKNILKCVLAGIVAVAFLCLLLTPYFLSPIHIENPDGNTDYVWPAGSCWCKMTEGISYGKFDKKGYNNIAVVDEPDILVLGSSHTEAVNVLQSQNFAAVLGETFRGRYSVYNMGISGHHFTKICNYLPQTAKLYPEAKYIIIETSDVHFSQDDIDALLNGTVDFTPSNSTGLVGTLQKLPFLRLTYHQLTSGLWELLTEKDSSADVPASAPSTALPEESVYDALFAHIEDTLERTDIQLIIMYHPTGTLQQDGSVSFHSNDAAVEMFGRKCQEYGFSFVDMTQPFEQMYASEHKLPHGFITGKIGEGHINVDGHAKIAEELAKCIATLEEVE